MLADYEQEWLGEERFDGETGVLDGERDDGEINLTLNGGAGEVRSKILAHIDLEIGVTLATTGDESGQDIGSDRRDRAHRDPTLQSGMVAEFFGGVFDFEQDPPGAFEEDFAGFGEDGFAAETVKKFTSDLGLKIYYLLA
jgi:hypothetical protein